MINNKNRIYSSTSKYTLDATIIAAKTNNNTLNQYFVESTSESAISVHVKFKTVVGWSSKRVKILSTSEFIHVNSNPVFTRLVRRIGVTDE
jgi:LEA14-like dessication related protein